MVYWKDFIRVNLILDNNFYVAGIVLGALYILTHIISQAYDTYNIIITPI